MNTEEQLVECLQKGGVAVLRTDTLYGLVARVDNEEAVERVYTLKQRDTDKPCIVLIPDASCVPAHQEVINRLTEKYKGIPTSILVPKSTEPAWITRGQDSVAYRIPQDENLRNLLRQTGSLIAPSANPQGLRPARNIDEAREYFGQSVSCYLDGGEVSSQIAASQLIQVNADGSETKLR
ncbi:MAG: L-threonylcarbamoyladenylate synthase [Patescibacteria group bacterium]